MTAISLYAGMLAFDAATIAVFAYLIRERRWSPSWWIVAALMCAGSDPTKLIAMSMKCDVSHAIAAPSH